MPHRILERTVALGLAALITLAVLGSLDTLAQPDEAAAQWAQAAAPHA
jgi:hypothetical protein